MSRPSDMTSGQWREKIYDRKRWEKKQGNCEPGAGADALGGGGGRSLGFEHEGWGASGKLDLDLIRKMASA